MPTSESTSPSAPPSAFAQLTRSATARDGVTVMLAQILAIAIALGLDVLLFRTLPQGERGTLSATLALRNVLLYVADIGLALTTVRVASGYLASGDTTSANAVFRRAFTTRLALASLVLLLAALLAPALTSFPLAAPNRQALVWAAAAGIIGMTLTSWGVDVAQSTRRFGLYLFHHVLEAGLRALTVALFILAIQPFACAPENILWVMAAAALVAGLVSTFIHRDIFKQSAPLPPDSRAALHDQLKSFGRYAGAVALLQIAGGCVELFLLQWQSGPVDTAVFDGARRLASVLPIVGGALTTVLLPRAAALQSTAECAAYVQKSFLASAAMALIFAGGLAACAGVIVPLLWGARYDASIPALRWLCLAYGFSMILNPLSLILFPLKRLSLLVALNAASLLLSLTLGFYFISSQGVAGAVWSAVLSKGISLALFVGAILWALYTARQKSI